MNIDLFESEVTAPTCESLGAESFVLRGAALPFVEELLPRVK